MHSFPYKNAWLVVLSYGSVIYIPSYFQIADHMPAKKRSYEEMAETPNPFLPIFDGFRVEIDENHLARERVIKASRDVTALSKKA